MRRQHFCFYCETNVLNFARHIKRNHPMDIEVQEILSKKINSKERKKLLAKLRKKLNFLIGESVKPVKQPNLPGTTFLPCS